MITTIITTALGALLIAAILAAFKSRWLYVIAPKLYLNTPISDGQIISIDIFNAGLLAEEDVAITFRPACKFELIATSKSTLSVNGKTLSVPKLSRLESISVLLLFEGKAFEQNDIESIDSKATKGKMVEKKENATSFWQHIIVIPILILVFGLPFWFGTVVGAEMRVSAFTYLEEKLEIFGHSKQLAGFKSTLTQKYSLSSDENYVKSSKILISIIEVVRRGDVLTIKLKISNKSNEVFTIEGHSDSTAGENSPLSFSDSRIEKFGMMPNNSKVVKFKIFLPEDLQVKIVVNDFTFTTISGESISLSQTIDFSGA